MERELIIVFDGLCNLCEYSVNFVIRRDKRRKFRFTPAQSPVGIDLQKRYGINVLDLETMVLIKDGVAYTKSSAAIEIARNLDGYWKILASVKIVPRPVRDWAYSKIAQNRQGWFGKKASCMIPSIDIRSRFL